MKLVKAKCPSCGANIEVDENSDKTKCEYCYTQILVEDAIAKIKIDVIKPSSDIIDNAKEYAQMEKFEDSKKILSDLIHNEPFNMEAIILYMNICFEEFEYYKQKDPEHILGAYLSAFSDECITSYIEKIVVFDVTGQYKGLIDNAKKAVNEYNKLFDESYNRTLEAGSKKGELQKKCSKYFFENKKNKTFKELFIKFARAFNLDLNSALYACPPRPSDIKIIFFNENNITFDTLSECYIYKFKEKTEKTSDEEKMIIMDKLLEDTNKSIIDKMFRK